MPTKPKLLVRFFVFIAFAAITVLIVIAGWRERMPLSIQEKNQSPQRAREERMMRDVNTLPEAIYQTHEGQDGTDRQLRNLKSKRYNAGTKPFEDLEDNTEKTKLYCSWGAPDVEAFPAAESNLIVIGTVTDAKGYVSEDRSAAYSEYAVNVTEVLKGADKLTSKSIIAEREGAKIALSDGRRYWYWVMKQGTPQIGYRYLLFLKDTPEGKDYSVLTGYELSKGRVSPLDAISGKYEEFDGHEESAFLEIVRSSVK